MSHTATLPNPRLRYLSRKSEKSTLSEDDIQTIERILQLIDLKNGVLACVSNWFAAWRLAQEIAFDFEGVSPEIRQHFAKRFKEVIEKMRDQGNVLASMAVVDVLAITDDHFRLATGHYLDDLGACIAFLDDRLIQWFEGTGEDVCASLWQGEEHGAGALVPKS